MKELYRSNKDKKIAGICAGVGEMFNIDPTIVRLAFVFVCVLTGVFPLIATYAVGWLIIPEKSYRETQEENVT